MPACCNGTVHPSNSVNLVLRIATPSDDANGFEPFSGVDGFLPNPVFLAATGLAESGRWGRGLHGLSLVSVLRYHDLRPWRQALFRLSLQKVYGVCMHVYTYMATKTISITKAAYDRLKARKGPDESFSDVVLRLTERRPLAEYAGMLSKSSVKAIREGIEEARRERRKLDVRA